MSVDISELRKLPVSEKLRLVEMLWNEIEASKAPIELQPWQFEEANRRSLELSGGNIDSIDSDELWRRVDG